MSFPHAAREAVRDSQLRANLARATRTIRDKRARVVGELTDWEELREAGARIKDDALLDLDRQLQRLEASVEAAGGTVHWARDGAAANRVVASVARSHGLREVAKVKSIATDEIGLNEALERDGIAALETDLAELIVQLAHDRQSHILVPAIHLNRAEIRDVFRRELGARGLGDDPAALTEVARRYLRERFLSARMGVSGANFAVAETGAVCVVESEGNGRMCTTLPDVLVTVMGIEKVVPSWRDMEVMLQLLPRSSTGERMNPYTSLWTGVRDEDGPREFHLVLLDNGRTRALADRVGRQALRCIRCSACLNVCPVYSRTGGHAYGSVYPGPIGAILTPQLEGVEVAGTLPYASSLCGACAEVCPVKIDIPEVLVHLRAQVVHARPRLDAESLAMKALARTFASRSWYERAQRVARTAGAPLARGGSISRAPGPLAAWTSSRDLPPVAKETFREWWQRTRGGREPRSPGTGPGAAVRPSAPGPPGSAAGLASAPGTWSSSTSGTEPSGTPDPEPAGDREAVLLRIRSALGDDRGGPPRPPRGYRLDDRRSRSEIVDLFAERVGEYRASVHRIPGSEIADAAARILSEVGAGRLGIPPDLPDAWRPPGVEVVEDHGLSPAELDRLDGALTGCAVAIAETGTFVLDGQAGQGRRALTLVPDLHVCVVRAEQVVGIVPEAIAQLDGAAREGRPLTFVSGPSATSDIELSRVEGVHGPRNLHVLLTSG
jgi:L-lactate dehydrogenase complex protein LldF